MRVPKRIRLGLTQKPHGRKSRRLFSFQREWLERRNAESFERALIAHNEKMAELEAIQPKTFLEALDLKIRAAELGMAFSVNAALFYGVDVNFAEMPLNPEVAE